MTLPTSSAFDHLMQSRRSVRAFLPEPVPRAAIDDILRIAARAPSGTNTQPWKVHVLTGDSKRALSARLCAIFDDPERMARQQRRSIDWPQPYLARRRKVGWDLYGLLQIAKHDKAAMHAQHRRNLDFFDAPVGLIFTMERFMQASSYLDTGMFLQSIMLAARVRQLDTCPQGVFIQFQDAIADCLGFGEEEQVVCGMALGYRDDAAPENGLETGRASLEQFVRYLD